MAAATACTRCDEDGTTVVVEFSAVVAYLDLCERHLADLLRGARSTEIASAHDPVRDPIQEE